MGEINYDSFKKPFYLYESIEASFNYRSQNFDKVANTILRDGYHIKPNYLFRLDSSLPWFHFDRAVSYNFQSFEPISSLLQAHSFKDNQDCFKLAFIYLNNWIEYYRPPTEQELKGNWKETEENDFLWYDMAVGLRALRLAYMIDVLKLTEGISPSLINKLIDIIQNHKDYLIKDETFKFYNNHGLYQALGQIAMSRRFFDLPGMKHCYELGLDRLSSMLEQQFFKDGMHKEHSPGYHWMILRTLNAAIHSKLLTKAEQIEFIKTIEEAMSLFIKPNKMIVAFGDSVAASIKGGASAVKNFSSPILKTLLSGKKLTSDSEKIKIFSESGYAFVRTGHDSDSLKESYFAQQAGFHSQVHKHADHLTIEWFDKGKDILVDSGRYYYKGRTRKESELWKQGFWYSDPKRVYVEKTRAHNTVEIDGLDFPRRDIKPFGSALRRSAVSENGVYCIESECYPFKSIRFNRTIFICPNQFLITLDFLKDNTELHHDFKQWFHLGKELDITAEDGTTVDILHDNKQFASILSLMPEISLDSLEKGENDSSLNGWVTDDIGGKLIPNWAISFSAYQRSQVTFATLFSLHPKANLWETSIVAPSGQRGRLYWQDEAGYHTLGFTKIPNEGIKLKYRCKKEPFLPSNKEEITSE